MGDVNCPYCEETQKINHDDGYGYEEGREYNQICRYCDKIFSYTTTIFFSYEVEKAPCLNDKNFKHDFTKEPHSIAYFGDGKIVRNCELCNYKESEDLNKETV